ncbi:NUDIX domain-containing protein [Escherichia coli]
MKMIEVVAAIIERDGKILLAQRPAQSDQAGLWEFAGGKSSRMKASGRRWCVSYAKNWASKQLWVSMLPAISEKFRPDYPSSCLARTRLPRTLQAHEHQALVWCSPEEALQYPWPLLTFHY